MAGTWSFRQPASNAMRKSGSIKVNSTGPGWAATPANALLRWVADRTSDQTGPRNAVDGIAR